MFGNKTTQNEHGFVTIYLSLRDRGTNVNNSNVSIDNVIPRRSKRKTSNNVDQQTNNTHYAFTILQGMNMLNIDGECIKVLKRLLTVANFDEDKEVVQDMFPSVVD